MCFLSDRCYYRPLLSKLQIRLLCRHLHIMVLQLRIAPMEGKTVLSRHREDDPQLVEAKIHELVVRAKGQPGRCLSLDLIGVVLQDGVVIAFGIPSVHTHTLLPVLLCEKEHVTLRLVHETGQLIRTAVKQTRLGVFHLVGSCVQIQDEEIVLFLTHEHENSVAVVDAL